MPSPKEAPQPLSPSLIAETEIYLGLRNKQVSKEKAKKTARAIVTGDKAYYPLTSSAFMEAGLSPLDASKASNTVFDTMQVKRKLAEQDPSEEMREIVLIDIENINTFPLADAQKLGLQIDYDMKGVGTIIGNAPYKNLMQLDRLRGVRSIERT